MYSKVSTGRGRVPTLKSEFEHRSAAKFAVGPRAVYQHAAVEVAGRVPSHSQGNASVLNLNGRGKTKEVGEFPAGVEVEQESRKVSATNLGSPVQVAFRVPQKMDCVEGFRDDLRGDGEYNGELASCIHLENGPTASPALVA